MMRFLSVLIMESCFVLTVALLVLFMLIVQHQLQLISKLSGGSASVDGSLNRASGHRALKGAAFLASGEPKSELKSRSRR